LKKKMERGGGFPAARDIVNLTPHELVIAPKGRNGPVLRIPSSGDVRCINAEPQLLGCVGDNIEVPSIDIISEPRYSGLSGVIPEGAKAICVFEVVARYLVSEDGRREYPVMPLIFTPDLSAAGGAAVRSSDGQIVAVKRLCLWRR
jgi:hypothetical protein